MLRNSNACILTTNQQLDQYQVTWIWIQFTLMAYFHCRTRIQIWTQTGIPNTMAT